MRHATAQRLDRTFAALADPTRRALLGRLARGNFSVSELAKPFEMSLPGISKHLNVLERAGLIERGREAQWRPCRLKPKPLREAVQWLESYRAFWEQSLTAWKVISSDCNGRNPTQSPRSRLLGVLSHLKKSRSADYPKFTTLMKAQPTYPPSLGSSAPGGSGDLPFVYTRMFDAPRELVWKAWTDREHLMRWFGPKGFTLPVCSLDLRPGGVFHYCLRSADGQEMWGKWIFQEIIPTEKLVVVASFSDANGGIIHHPMSASWPLETLFTTTLVEHAGRTTLTLTWSAVNATAAERQTFNENHDGMRKGWTGTMDQLAEYLTSLKRSRS